MSNTQPRKPAGSTEGGQFAANQGSETSTTLPVSKTSVIVRGGIGYSDNNDVCIIDIDYLEQETTPDRDDIVRALVDRDILALHEHHYEAQAIDRWIEAWQQDTGEQVSDDMRNEAREEYERLDTLPYALIEGGLVQSQSENVEVIDLDIMEARWADGSSAEEALETADRAQAVGLNEEAEELRNWATARPHPTSTTTGPA